MDNHVITNEELDIILDEYFFEEMTYRGRTLLVRSVRDVIEEKIFKQIENRFRNENSLEKVIGEIIEWQKAQFPRATQKSRATHLLREAAELYVKPNDAIEAVDIIFLAVGIISETDFSLLELLNYKLEVNKSRQWNKIDSDGVVEHVKEEEDSSPHWDSRANSRIIM